MQRRIDKSVMPLAWLLAVALLAASPALAKEVVVKTTDGREITAELVSQDEEEVVLDIQGIELVLERSEIASMEERLSPAEQYRQQRAELEADDLDGRYALAFTMYQRGAYELAMRELRALELEFPDAERVARLKNAVQRTMDAEQTQNGQSDQDDGNGTDDGSGPAPLLPRLTEAQVNRIRVFEIDMDENPRIQIPDRALDAFLDKYGEDDDVPSGRIERARFKRANGRTQLRLMFNKRAREFYGDVIVRDDPPAMQTYRQRIHRQYTLNYCGTALCHGSDDAPGSLQLLRRAPMRTDTVYTNFYILHAYENEAGYMIDRTSPSRSLLVQYGLPRDQAQTPHPQTPRWRPRFIGTDDPQYQTLVAFLNSLWRPQPDYGIEYTPPGLIQEQPADENGAGETGGTTGVGGDEGGVNPPPPSTQPDDTGTGPPPGGTGTQPDDSPPPADTPPNNAPPPAPG